MFDSSTSKMWSQVTKLLRNRAAYACFGLLTFQQILEASTTIWLVMMMNEITAGESFFFMLFIYLITLVIPYIPKCLALIFRISWKQETQRSFINAFVSSNKNQIGEWSNKGIKQEKLSVLTSEGPVALGALIDYFYDLYEYVLSVFLNILTLSIVVEPLYCVAYGISVLLVFLVMIVKRRSQRRLTKKALSARIDLTQSLLAAWDNVLLGNLYNFNLWQDRTQQRINRCLQKNVELERFDQILAIVIALITCIPSLAVVVHYAYTHRHSVPELTAFLVTLPVLFMILSYTYQTLSLVFRWTMHKGKLVSIYKAIQPQEYLPASMEKKVKWEKIQISKNSSLYDSEKDKSQKTPIVIKSHQEMIPFTSQCGRFTLRGENGSGKSTLLMLIKHSVANRAFFLPTQNQLSFVSETNKYSTGESLRKRLHEILQRVQVDVLLLDEWDANLDSENQEKLSILIDEIAEKKCVIEVRHR